MGQVKQWLNSKNRFDCNKGYFSEGPEIRLWKGINSDHASDYGMRIGWQRVRLKFDVASPNGISDVEVLDGTRGLFRRFDGNGKKDFSVEFEAVHDRVHSLVLRVRDRKGEIAVSPELRIINPRYAITRCSDNLNLLGYSTLVSHPDQHQLASMRGFEDISSGTLSSDFSRTSIAGVDTALPFLFTPAAELNFNFFTDSGNQLGGSNMLDEWNAILQRYPVNSSGVSILTSDSTRRISTKNRHRGKKRIVYRNASFYPPGESQPIADIKHTSYLLRSRISPSLRVSMPWLAEDHYRGGLMWHELSFKFKKDVVLKGELPIQLVRMKPGDSFFNASRGYWNRFVAKTPDGILDTPVRKMCVPLANDGYVSVLSSNSSRRIVLIPSCKELKPAVQVTSQGTVWLGLGQEGVKIRKGDVVSVKLLVVSQTGLPNNADSLKSVADFFNPGNFKWHTEVGTLLDNPPFASFKAQDGEVRFSGAPVSGICDYPVQVQGIEDNGCAAYYELNSGKVFSFAPVRKSAMYFQTPTDNGVNLWAGNVFLASDKALKLTLVTAGQDPGKQPFLEIHNPTDRRISAKIWSPWHTPHFGGSSFEADVPAGSSLFCDTGGRKLLR